MGVTRQVSPPSVDLYITTAGPVGPQLLKLPVPARTVRPVLSPGAIAMAPIAVDGSVSSVAGQVGGDGESGVGGQEDRSAKPGRSAGP